jgi:Holliday junction resolvase RusA-like endonuclease
MARDSFSFSVWGLQPRPQGSKKYVGMRRTANGNNIPLIIESSNQLPQWRKAIEQAILQGMVDSGDDSKFEGAVRVECIFYLRKAKSNRSALPVVAPDVDKLARALLDSCKGVWGDDSQVVELVAYKQWASGEPGVQVLITKML